MLESRTFHGRHIIFEPNFTPTNLALFRKANIVKELIRDSHRREGGCNNIFVVGIDKLACSCQRPKSIDEMMASYRISENDIANHRSVRDRPHWNAFGKYHFNEGSYCFLKRFIVTLFNS